MLILSSDVLYNCCTGNQEPNWKQYAGLEIGGCSDEGGLTVGGLPARSAEFFTVYGRTPDGEAEAITDVHPCGSGRDETLGRAARIAAHLGKRAGLPVTLYRLA